MFKPRDVLTPDFLRRDTDSLWTEIVDSYSVDEALLLQGLLELATPDSSIMDVITREGSRLIEAVRANDDAMHMIDALLLEYSLDTQEGILLMCLAEALMRIPDTDTAAALIRDKLSVADWEHHLSSSESVLVNASTWGLMLTGKVVTLDSRVDGRPAPVIHRLLNRLGEPVIRRAMNQAMKIMGKHFVLGRNIDEALKNGRKKIAQGYSYSFDMLGEAALTADDADRYLQSYLQAIAKVGKHNSKLSGTARDLPSISIKLSALHPRYEVGQKARVLTELYDSVLQLASAARACNVGITIDAEEMDRLELSLELFKKLYQSPAMRGWGNFGLVVQAYSKRALPVLAWLGALAREQGDVIPLRLVKGAYWDTEIKLAQQKGLASYPVFTRKEATDLSYLACAEFLFSEAARNIYPQFATHNAHTVASVKSLAKGNSYEFQRLHGMGDALYDVVMANDSARVRIYAPVGQHKDLLPYLVRRLLENGANSSFVHRLVDANTPVSSLVRHPAEQLQAHQSLNNDRIPLPADILEAERLNSAGINVDIESQWQPLAKQVAIEGEKQWQGGTLIDGVPLQSEKPNPVFSPFDRKKQVGQAVWACADDVVRAIDSAAASFDGWNQTSVDVRASCLETMADLMEAHRPELVALCHLEAGKTIHDSLDEIREAVDFCRYYAQQARLHFANPMQLPGPTGESNELLLQGRGVFACISPWNFPLAIFIGQVVAALVAGNTVVAKPAEQTTLIATRAVELLIQSGVPVGVIHLLAGEGAEVGNAITQDERIAGVAFTGSTDTAQRINRTLANRTGAIAPLIAETGGQNAMIVDSTALPEQVVADAVESAFKSAGQRCSALRVLYVQEDVAPRVTELLQGAMAELVVGDPRLHTTDVGPVIDERAQQMLDEHIATMRQKAEVIAETPLATTVAQQGCYVAPIAFRIDSMAELHKENFGPILHLISFKSEQLDAVIEEVNASGYGLTLGVHTRNEVTARRIEQGVRVGNIYINRNQIGATVGVQPFGGQGLSGTGPKAGGPRYLYRFASERTLTVNTTAVGGNASLLSLESELA
ncbi:bifunctional proline dehydrogenase/L-glutamate gamma-semialdehyde dehydrogenase PutA [Aestuariirhabdus sp. Z084]|uniref:bifunctional proline dehydrogenase/L-glutamate gamma-semialdehyde dehydrogenase PutA n=1 Tax=Aestuariirhabdus haliotis TaxID=2918751 RepID=UPI00201B3AC9|nr:bifunctional proline dehydrogenase/L-glutamate gamma-semialdehyde dehydrogenase PutA [Aestuariirhabdus haliotis]MCL6416753.1 bifunctional proline dehydrogenase/L-glutamate gamma-semialdehyde dehydrogenase PutA [Aestuariirhabdus haliotis]MCL6420782.1 bifunctional proline dehydrogenase/L-glutamate gamma-semialdehyde dehydrogenase PutA [Aestuariirhabdus haliotis]